MNISLCLMEFMKISKAYVILNELTHKFPVKIFLNGRICPGRYICLLEGKESDVVGCHEYVLEMKDVNSKVVSSISPEVTFAIKSKRAFEPKTSIGIFEFTHSIDAIKYSDLAFKKSGITINKLDFSMGLFGKGIVYCSGKNTELFDFREYLLKEVPAKDIVGLEVISGPSQELMEIL